MHDSLESRIPLSPSSTQTQIIATNKDKTLGQNSITLYIKYTLFFSSCD